MLTALGAYYGIGTQVDPVEGAVQRHSQIIAPMWEAVLRATGGKALCVHGYAV